MVFDFNLNYLADTKWGRLFRVRNSLYPILMIFGSCLNGFLISCISFYDIMYNINQFFLILIGALLLRSAGCIFNDIVDKDLDLLSERTKNRPIATGEISVIEGLIAISILLGACALIWIFQLNLGSKIECIFASLLFLVYPFSKRFIGYPELILSLIMGMPAIVCSMQVLGYFDYSILVYYFASVYWTISNSAFYNMQDYESDLKNGILSMAVIYHTNIYKKIIFDITISMFSVFVLGVIIGVNLLYYMSICIIFSIVMISIAHVDINNPKSSLFCFKVSSAIPLMLSIGICIGKFI